MHKFLHTRRIKILNLYYSYLKFITVHVNLKTVHLKIKNNRNLF